MPGAVLPSGAADLLEKLSSKDECVAILRFIERKYHRVARESVTKPSLDEFPEELKSIQAKQDEVEEEYIRDAHELNMEHQQKLNPLYNRRYEIVAGITDQGAGVPNFWLSALTADSDFKAVVSEQDAKVLKYLRDVRSHRTLHPMTMKIEFIFDPSNPYFTNTVLTKVFSLSVHDGQTIVHDAQGTPIHWNHDVGLEHPGKKRKRTTSGYPSFFNFFDAPGEEDDAAYYRKKLEKDYHVYASVIAEKVIPRALSLCLDP